MALFEAAKGCLAVLTGFGLLWLVHGDVHGIVERLVTDLHVNPANKYPRVFLNAATVVTDRRLWLLSGLVFFYAAVRLLEGYGLWLQKRWAEWLAACSAGVYLPIEIYEIIHRATLVKMLVLAINLAVVVYMSYVLWKSKAHTAQRS